MDTLIKSKMRYIENNSHNTEDPVKQRTLIMKKILLLLFLLLISTQAISGKLYKWVDKDGRVNYTQTPPPDDAGVDDAKEMNISSTVIKPTKKRGKYYCGTDQLPNLSDKPATNISNLQYKIYDWEEAIERREKERSKYIKRRYYSVENFNREMRRNNQEDLEDRCKIEWANKQLRLLQGDKREIIQRYDDIKVAIGELESRKLSECGKDDRTGFVVVDDEYREYLDCIKRYDGELRRLKRELRKAENNRDMVEIE